MFDLSLLQQMRLSWTPPVADALRTITKLSLVEDGPIELDEAIASYFPNLCGQKRLRLARLESKRDPLRVGVVLSGGQASGGHNVIAGIFDALKEFHPDSVLIGFLNGPAGIVSNSYREITTDYLASYRNQGGFDIIGSGRTKIQTDEQFEKALTTVRAHDLDGLIIIGGDDSNTNAAFLAEYFLAHGCKTCVNGVPKTIDGDLRNEAIELSFGFDTACKTYSECIGNIQRDAISAKKYYYFVKLMGRSASHITLECALQTHPNMALIAEEAEARGWHLKDLVDQIVELVLARKLAGKEYGVVLIPEGIIEFLPDMKSLIAELNGLLAPSQPHLQAIQQCAAAQEKISYILRFLSGASLETMQLLPAEIQMQLLLDRDPHGNVQVSKIETERLFIHMVSRACSAQNLTFSGQPIFYGYEGRSCLPTNFDAAYCYNLGLLAALVVQQKKTGYIVSFKNLTGKVPSWQPVVSPLVSMLHEEVRDGKKKAVIEKALVDLQSAPFKQLQAERGAWRLDDCYRQPGPIQFWGPPELVDTVPLILCK